MIFDCAILRRGSARLRSAMAGGISGSKISCLLAGYMLAGSMLAGCRSGSATADAAGDADSLPADIPAAVEAFSADSAFSYVKRQTDFGPRVPNTDAHRRAGDWIAATLRRHGAEVTEIPFEVTAFDGTRLRARNIFAQYRPEAKERLLLLAHWDCRPWADEDPDPAKRRLPVDGANDGASGVGVILGLARQLKATPPAAGVDILFVDAEDWGSSDDEDSWALGARHFAQNPPIAGYAPKEAILLDMVGGKEPLFCREYFSQQAAPALMDALWKAAAQLGYGDIFSDRAGSAVNDDHLQLIQSGIPAVDIIEYHPESGFCPTWHTADDTIDNISPKTLEAVGKTVAAYIWRQRQ